MGLKTYSLRLDEKEFEKLRKALDEHGDPDVDIGYLIRSYIRDLNTAMPNLKKTSHGLKNTLAIFGSLLKAVDQVVDIRIANKGRK